MYLCYRSIKYRLEGAIGAIKNGQSRETPNIGHPRNRTKTNKTNRTTHKKKQKKIATVSTVWYSSFIILFIGQSLRRVGRWVIRICKLKDIYM
jgi:hypothetical protein